MNFMQNKAVTTRRATRAIICGLSLSALLLAASARPAHALVVNELETTGINGANDTFATAQGPLNAFFSDQSSDPNIFRNDTNDPTAPVFQSVSVNGQIGNAIDVDFYSFFGVAGSTAFFDIDADTFGVLGIEDSILSLFDPSGTLVAFNDDASGDPGSNDPALDTGNNSFIGVYNLSTTGLYRVAVSGYDITPTGRDASPTSNNLTRPDGDNGGEEVVDATPNDSSFNFSDAPGETGSYTLNVSLSQVVPAPEPGTMTLMGIGLASLGAARRKKKGQSKDDAIA